MLVPDIAAIHRSMPTGVLMGAALAAWPVWNLLAIRLIPAMMRRWENFGTFSLSIALATVAFAPTGILVINAVSGLADHVSTLAASGASCRLERFLPNGQSAGVMFLKEGCPVLEDPHVP